MRKILGRRRASAALGLFLAIAVVGAAFAYWTQSGSGSGSANTGTIVALTVQQTSTVSGLYPGGPAQALAGTITNPNAGPVKVGSVTAVVDPAWSDQANGALNACTAADFTIGGSAAINAEVPTGLTAWSGLTIQMDNLGTNQDNCKSVTVPILYTVDAAP